MQPPDAHWSEMDHARANESQTAERYVLGKLPEAERRAFEEHFVDCPKCLETLETVESLRSALREVQPRDASPSVARPIPIRPARRWAPLLAAACVGLAVLSSIFFFNESRRTRRDLVQARGTSERALGRQAELEEELRREQAALRALRAAPRATSVVVLNLTRGADSPAPSNRIELGASPGWVTLLFDRPDRSGIRDYRVRITTTDGRALGDAVTAQGTAGGILGVSLPSDLLPPGDYVLTVEGVGTGRAETLATYRFRVAPGK